VSDVLFYGTHVLGLLLLLLLLLMRFGGLLLNSKKEGDQLSLSPSPSRPFLLMSFLSVHDSMYI
jgi:hypothetical protein